MLKIFYDMQESIYNTSVYFKNMYEEEWITEPMAMEMTKDIIINLRHLMDFGDERFDIEILNTGKIVHSMKELIPIAGELAERVEGTKETTKLRKSMSIEELKLRECTPMSFLAALIKVNESKMSELQWKNIINMTWKSSCEEVT